MLVTCIHCHEKFEKEVDVNNWHTGEKVGTNHYICKCVIDENNRIVLKFYVISSAMSAGEMVFMTSTMQMSIDFDFTDDSYTFECCSNGNWFSHVEKDKSAFPEDFDRPPFTRLTVIALDNLNEENDEVWDIDNCELSTIIDYDLVNEKYCDLDIEAVPNPDDHTVTIIKVEDKIGETEHRRLVKKYFFDNKLVEMPGKLAEELGIEE